MQGVRRLGNGLGGNHSIPFSVFVRYFVSHQTFLLPTLCWALRLRQTERVREHRTVGHPFVSGCEGKSAEATFWHRPRYEQGQESKGVEGEGLLGKSPSVCESSGHV